MIRIDLNADIGELEGAEGRALDRQILQSVTSCNIACGGHAGDIATMRETVKAAKEFGVSIGAHPSYPDRENFGRVRHDISNEDLEKSLRCQISAIMEIVKSEGAAISHVKPHGALYNDAAKDEFLAEMLCRLTKEFGISRIFGLPGSKVIGEAQRIGLEFVAEGFSDRRYAPDGSLTPRTMDGAVLHHPQDVMDQACDLVCENAVTASNDDRIALTVQTLCLHGDTEGAAELSEAIRSALIERSVEIASELGNL